jgi:hypothetical protein
VLPTTTSAVGDFDVRRGHARLDDGIRTGKGRGILVYVTARFLSAYDADSAVETGVHNTAGQPVYDVRVHWVDAGKRSQAGGKSS